MEDSAMRSYGEELQQIGGRVLHMVQASADVDQTTEDLIRALVEFLALLEQDLYRERLVGRFRRAEGIVGGGVQTVGWPPAVRQRVKTLLMESDRKLRAARLGQARLIVEEFDHQFSGILRELAGEHQPGH